MPTNGLFTCVYPSTGVRWEREPRRWRPVPEAVTWMRKRKHGRIAKVASLLLFSLLAGVVVAAAVFPVAAIGGLAAKAGAGTFDGLPTDVAVLPSPQISYVYASDGRTLLAV